MDGTNIAIPGYISLNDTLKTCAMEMVIEGYKTHSISLIDKALTIMEVFKDAPLIDMETKKFNEKFGE